MSALHERLQRFQKNLLKATEDALKQQNSSSISSISNSHQAVKDCKSNASFLLGMDLFGQETSVVERTIRDKLQEIEDELQKLVLQSKDDATIDENSIPEESSCTHLSPDQLEQQAAHYRAQIAFLKQASLTRTLLDESRTSSSAALSQEPSLVEASQQLLKAQEHFQMAQDLFTNTATARSEQEAQVARQIIQHLKESLRAHKVGLLQSASNIIDISVQMSSNSIHVKNEMKLLAAYQVLETLEQPSSVTSATTGTTELGPHLQETLRSFTERLYQEILLPILQPHPNANDTTKAPLTKPTATLIPWKITQSADLASRRFLGGSSSSAAGPSSSSNNSFGTKAHLLHRLEWHRRTGGTPTETKSPTPLAVTSLDAWRDSLELIRQVLLFCQSKVLLERPVLVRHLATKLFGKPAALPSCLDLNALGLESQVLGDDHGLLMDQLVRRLAANMLPDDLLLVTAQDFQQLAQTQEQLCKTVLEPFCQAMEDANLLVSAFANTSRQSSQTQSSNALLRFGQSLAQNYIEHRRCVQLNQARDLLREMDYHNTLQVGKDIDPEDPTSIFRLQRSSISEVAQALVKLVRQTMDESVQVQFESHQEDGDQETKDTEEENALKRLRPALYKTAREMFSLYRAIIPAMYGAEVKQVPRTAAVLHNDCVYLAHHCLTMGLEYREQYPEDSSRGKLLRQSCIFVDMVPLFRELADTTIKDMMDLQKFQLLELVGPRIEFLPKALGSHDPVQEWSDAESGVVVASYHLRHLSQAWKPILATSVFEQCLGYLVDVIVSMYFDRIGQATYVSPRAKQFLNGLIRKSHEDWSNLLPALENWNDEFAKMTSLHLGYISQEWSRWHACRVCLECGNPQDVQTALGSGQFQALQSSELSRLVQSCFPASPSKQALLQVLSNHYPRDQES